MKTKKLTPEQIEDERINNLHIMDFLFECEIVTEKERNDFFDLKDE